MSEVKEFFKVVGGDYEDVVKRLVSEQTVVNFVVRFLSDDTFGLLQNAFDTADVEAAFRAAHTLKGIALNLGFGDLGKSAAELTEILRAKTFDGTADVFLRVRADYDKVIEAIKTYL